MSGATLVFVSLLIAVPVPEKPREPESTSWVGKIVVVIDSTAELGNLNVRGELTTPLTPVTGMHYRVYDERGNFVQIKTRESITGWFDKKNLALVDDAIAHSSKQLKQNPNDLHALNHRGWALSLKGDHVAAVKDLTEAIRISPSVAYYNNRARILVEKGDYDQALADYNTAIDQGPQFFLPLFNRGVCWAFKKDFDKAIADFDRSLALNADFASAYRNRADAWLAKKNYDRALADCNQAIRIDPKDDAAYISRSKAWLGKKDFAKAIADCNHAIRLDPKQADAFTNRGHALSAKKEFDKALADFYEATWRGPKDARPIVAIAWLLATCPNEKLRDGKRALELAREAMALDKSRADLHADSLAAAYAETGNFEEAVRWQERALQAPELKNDTDSRRRLELYRKKLPYRQE